MWPHRLSFKFGNSLPFADTKKMHGVHGGSDQRTNVVHPPEDEREILTPRRAGKSHFFCPGKFHQGQPDGRVLEIAQRCGVLFPRK